MDEMTLTQCFVGSVENTKAAMYHTALSMMRNPSDAEDAVSTAIEITWSHRNSIREAEKMPGYLLRTTIHSCHALLRKRKREVVTEFTEENGGQTRDEAGLWEYLDHLPEKFRLPLILRYGEGLPEKEIVSILGITRGTVSSRLSRGLDLLRKEMKEEIENNEK